MNLQITSPYAPCPFVCPYCVSNFEGKYPYRNLFEEDPDTYFNNMRRVLDTGKFTGVVFTGMTDPTLFPEWIEEVRIFLLKEYPELEEVVLQTSNIAYKNNLEFDVIAYSISHRRLIDRVPHCAYKGIVRYNMMLSKDLTFADVLDLYLKSDAQYTIKYLQLTSSGHGETDKWIKENRLELTTKEWQTAMSLGIWVDDSCMDSENRYRIFRENGKLYSDWYSKVPIKGWFE